MPFRLFWTRCLLAIVAAGIASRLLHTGFAIFDKYLGDALYAAMVYAILRLMRGPKTHVATLAMLAMTSIELFQLAGIPASWHASGSSFAKLCARVTGTTFGWLDLGAYAAGIACIWKADKSK